MQQRPIELYLKPLFYLACICRLPRETHRMKSWKKTRNKVISQHEWNTLRYPVTLHQLSEEEGGGWLATIPQLGRAAFTADGETAAEALEELETLRRELYEEVIASGQPIPLPEDAAEEKAMPSGKWLLRTLPRFHAELQEAAAASGLSFNAYCNHVLERGHATLSMHRAAQEVLRSVANGDSRQTSSLEIPSQHSLRG